MVQALTSDWAYSADGFGLLLSPFACLAAFAVWVEEQA